MITIILLVIVILTFSSNTIMATSHEDNQDVPQESLEDSNIVSLYCWDIDDFNLSKLKDEVECLNINTLYIQRPSSDAQIDRLKEIMEFAKQYQLDVFLLEGARDWLTEGDMNNVIHVIDEASSLNKMLDYPLKGVSMDVEFYLTDEYQSSDTERQRELFKTFTENTKKCCDYANHLGLEYSMALPVWLDKLSEDILEELMNYHYDHIAFMNYFKETIMENLDQEVEIAKRHNIKMVSIAEVQDPKFGTVGEEDTFYHDGLEQCISTLNAIRQKYHYKNLGISYHYYKPLLDLLERDTDVKIENRYELQVFPYINGTSIKVEDAQISGNGNKFEPIYGYDSKNGKNVLIFYGLEYGKQYKLKIESGNLVGTKTFIYQKDDEIFDDIEIGYMDIMLEEKAPGEDKPAEDKPSEDNPSENKPSENKPSENKPSDNLPSNDKPSESKPTEDKPSDNRPSNDTPSKDTRKDDTVSLEVLPQAGENNFILILLIISIMITIWEIMKYTTWRLRK